MRLVPLYRLGIPALALGQGLSEVGFVLAVRAGLTGGDSPWLLAAVAACVLLRFAFQDRGAALEARALRDATTALRGRLLEAVRRRAVPAWRPEIRRRLDQALGELVPRAAEGMLARRRFEGAALQIVLFVPLLLILSWKTALLGIAFAALLWPVLRLRNRSLKALEAAGVAGRDRGEAAREDFGELLEARTGDGFGELIARLDAGLAAAHEPEWRWRRAQLRYPAVLETGLFFVLTALLFAGALVLPDWNALLLFSLLLLLAYRPVREAARHWPASLAGEAALREAGMLAARWEVLPPRRMPDAHPDGNALALRGVTFGYEPGRPILENFDAAFPAADITGVTGPNGAGKTTLLRLLAGAEFPDEGRILWSDAARAHGVAHLPQRAWPGRDWAAWAAALRRERPDRWRELDALLNLERLADSDSHPAARSGGERQRMALARALDSNAAFLLLDEPVTALPANEREPILRGALALWRRGGRGAIVVSHETFLPALCDRVIRMGG